MALDFINKVSITAGRGTNLYYLYYDPRAHGIYTEEYFEYVIFNCVVKLDRLFLNRVPDANDPINLPSDEYDTRKRQISIVAQLKYSKFNLEDNTIKRLMVRLNTKGRAYIPETVEDRIDLLEKWSDSKKPLVLAGVDRRKIANLIISELKDSYPVKRYTEEFREVPMIFNRVVKDDDEGGVIKPLSVNDTTNQENVEQDIRTEKLVKKSGG